MYTEKEEAFYQWLKSRFNLNLSDASVIAQFLNDLKKERINTIIDAEQASIDFTSNKLRNIGGLLSEDYRIGYQEGIKHWIESQQKFPLLGDLIKQIRG